jgi:hypothetical protein
MESEEGEEDGDEDGQQIAWAEGGRCREWTRQAADRQDDEHTRCDKTVHSALRHQEFVLRRQQWRIMSARGREYQGPPRREDKEEQRGT